MFEFQVSVELILKMFDLGVIRTYLNQVVDINQKPEALAVNDSREHAGVNLGPLKTQVIQVCY